MRVISIFYRSAHTHKHNQRFSCCSSRKSERNLIREREPNTTTTTTADKRTNIIEEKVALALFGPQAAALTELTFFLQLALNERQLIS